MMEDHPGSAAQGGALAEALARCVGARIDAALAPGRAPGVLLRPMGMTMLRMRTAALVVLAWGSACGGNVVVDGMPDGSGGAGATSSSAVTSGATTNGATGVSAVGVGGSSVSAVSVGPTTAGVGGMGTSGTGISTGAGGADAWSMCVNFCERYSEACDEVTPGGCGAICDARLSEAPRCNELLVPFFDCATNGRIDCGSISRGCQPFLNRYNECRDSGSCTELECFNDRERACSCKGSCPNAAFAVECRPNMFHTISCSCFVNGEELGTCEDVGEVCDLAHGCCDPVFHQFR